ncbi:hypothetical protein ACFQ68_37025 [Amycolatopsis japonica]|uniref:hypothetical protein n=1 Tax=Amycolatopsis japonica TaxID=208439 RepID=UPI00366B0A8A
MSDSARRGDDGAPYVHAVEPPKPVWVDLRVVFPVDTPRGSLPDGLDLTGTVPGTLSTWAATVTGHWVGWVTFPLGIPGEGASWHRQWVLADALKPRSG